MYYVYEWYRMDLNLPYYIGKGKDKRAYALKRNRHADYVTNYLISNGIRREVRIIAKFKTEEMALAYEIERIAFWWYLKEHDILTNETLGGEGFSGGKHTDKTKSVLSIKQKEIQNRPENLKASRERMLGNPSRTGMKDSEETRAKKKAAIKAARGKTESIEKTRAASTAIHSCPEFKARHKAACKEAANRPEVKAKKIRTGANHPLAKAVICLEDSKIFSTVVEAEKYYGINNIHAAAKGKQKTAGGRRFSYLDNKQDK
jgi:hypothetical protein